MGIFSFFSKKNTGNTRILTSADLADLIGGADTSAGVSVTASSAIQFSTVWACVRLLAESIAQLPVHVYIRNKDGSKSRVYDLPLSLLLSCGPNSWQTSFEYTEFMVTSLAMAGNHYGYISRNGSGELLEIIPFVPSAVKPVRKSLHDIATYEVTTPTGGSKTYKADDITHVRGLTLDGFKGVSPIAYHRETIGLASAAEQYGGRLFKNGARPSGVIRHPQTLSREAYEKLKKYWQAMYGGQNIGKTAILEEGAEYQTISMSNEDAQYLDVRQFQRTEICSIFRIPPHMIGDLTKASFSNITQQSLEFVKYTILPWCRRIESAMMRDLLTEEERRKGFFVQYLVDGLERADIKTRYEAYRTGIFGGFLSPNEVRRRENMNPRPNGDLYLAPLNMVDSSESMTKPEKAAVPAYRIKGANSREALRSVYKSRFKTVAAAVLRRESDLVRAALKPGITNSALELELSKIYQQFPFEVSASFRALVREYAVAVRDAALDEVDAVAGQDIDIEPFVDDILESMAARHVGSSAGQLATVIADAADDDAVAAVEQRLQEWRSTRPQKMADREVVQQESAVARFVWGAAGVTQLQWMRRGSKSCPFCTDLDGTIVGIDAPFVDKGDYTPDGYEHSAWRVRGPKMHAPLHQGCQCVIVPV